MKSKAKIREHILAKNLLRFLEFEYKINLSLLLYTTSKAIYHSEKSDSVFSDYPTAVFGHAACETFAHATRARRARVLRVRVQCF